LQVAFALLGLLVDLELLNALFHLAHAHDLVFFLFPLGFESVRALANLGKFTLNDVQAVLGIGVVFLLERLALDFELRGAAFELVDVGRKRVDLEAQRGGGFVD
jgi:hypothetical protein